MEEQIQFIAKYGDWVTIKKQKITDKTTPDTIMLFLSSLSGTFDRKIGENLAKIVDISKVEEFIDEFGTGKKKEEEIAEVLRTINGPKLGRVINEVCEPLTLQKKDKQQIKDFCKIYAVRRAMMNMQLPMDFSALASKQTKVKGAKKMAKD